MNNVEMPKMGDTMETGKILNWIKKVGDVVKKGEPLAEVETDKVNIEIEAFYNGTLRKILVPEGESAPIGAPIALIGSPDEPLSEDAKGKSDGAPAREAARPSNGATKAAAPAQTSTAAAPAPTAQAAPAPAQVSTATVERAPNGRIIKLDVEAALARQPQVAPAAPAAQPMPAPEPEAVPAAVEAGEVVEIPLTAMRRTIPRRLRQCMQTGSQFFITSV